jgi:Reverse transcriptase (RNA-dependent DNA polymerase)
MMPSRKAIAGWHIGGAPLAYLIADDWLITCRSREEAQRALASAREVLEGQLGLRLHPEKTRIVHITRGFEFLGYKIGRGKGLRHKAGGPSLYAVPTDRSIKRFKDKVRTATGRRNPKDLEGILDELNPDHPRLGQLLPAREGAPAVSPPQPLDRDARLEPPTQALAQRRVAASAGATALRGVGPGQPLAAHSEHGELLPPEGLCPGRGMTSSSGVRVPCGG